MLKSGLFCINEEVIGKIVAGIWSRRILIILEAEVIRKIVMGTWNAWVLIFFLKILPFCRNGHLQIGKVVGKVVVGTWSARVFTLMAGVVWVGVEG